MRSRAVAAALSALAELSTACDGTATSAGPASDLGSTPAFASATSRAAPSASAVGGVASALPVTAAAHAVLPREPGRFAPSFVEVDASAPPTGAGLADVDGCGRCHAEALAQWRESAHALASFNNPVYRAAVERLRREVGVGASRFCAGCHDIALLVDGAFDGPVAPSDARAHTGVSCRVCHGITSATLDGNASYTLRGGQVAVPVEGDPESVRAHRADVAGAALRTVELCGSCHRSFLGPQTGNPAHLTGMDDLSAWGRSVYAGSRASRIDGDVDEATCRGCHMPREPAPLGDAAARNGTIASHRFVGGHTYLAAQRRDAEQLRKAAAFLRGSASIDVAAVTRADGTRALPADGAALRPGERVLLDVVLRNQRVGHRFPGGTLDAHDVWVEVEVHDARGKLVAEAGTQHATTGADPTAHVLRAVQVDERGHPVLARETHRFRAVVYNHTLAPRDAAAVQFELVAPASFDAHPLPLRVTARLRHRSRNLTLHDASCADARAPRGSAFDEASKRITGTRLSACVAQPITDVAEAVAWVGGAGPVSARPAFERLEEHGLAMLHAVQERLDEARPSFEGALAIASTPRERARALWGLAALAGRQGRTDDALSLFDQAAHEQPDAPAIDRARGEALAQVWRWREAVGPLARAARAAPLDDAGWAALAVAHGSASDDRAALEAARGGLALQPRDADLLRVQALSLAALEAPEAAAARQAYLACRTPDEAPGARARCSRDVPGCALERTPVHAHRMRPASP